MKQGRTEGREGGVARRGGFTMVEVMVSLFLTILVMSGAYLVIIRASELSRAARNHYVAITLCKNRLERARNFDYEDLHLLQEYALVVNDNGAPSTRGMFARSTAVNTNFVSSASTNGLTEVVVTVQIRNRRSGAFGNEKEDMSMLFTEYLVP